MIPRAITLLFFSCLASSAIGFSPSSNINRRSSSRLTPLQRYDTSMHASIKQRLTFNSPPLSNKDTPKLILISGCPGTGKSTFGMSLALEQGILKCISTDTVRAVMRSYVPESISPPLHRSSYASSADDGSDDPVKSWKETCKVLESSLEGLVDDAIQRKVSLVLEGVSVLPSRKWCDKFTEAGGSVCGVLLTVSNEETHRNLLLKRGFITGNAVAEEKKLKSFDRVRLIQDEMIKMAKESGWVLIEQRVEPDPLDVVNDELFKNQSCQSKAELIDELEEDCLVPKVRGNKVSIDELVRAENEGTIGKTNTSINDLVRAKKEHMEAALAAGQEEQIEI